MVCPNCKRKDIGKIGLSQYYCWNCYIEISVVKGKEHYLQIEQDGTVSSLDDLFCDQDDQLASSGT